MKKIILGLFIFLSFGYFGFSRLLRQAPGAAELGSTLRAGEFEFFLDPQFQNGFTVKSPTPGSNKISGVFQAADLSGVAPNYGIAQWYSHSDIFLAPPQSLPSGATLWSDNNKSVLFGPPGTAEEGISLAVNSITEYGGKFRDGKTKDWPHLYFDQDIGTVRPTPSIASLSSLRIQGSFRLLREKVITSRGYNPSMHTAQFVVYFLVQNLNPKSPGYGGDFINFGFIPYDSRYDFIPAGIFPDPDGGHLIYQISMTKMTKTPMKSREWVHIDYDVFPDVQAALNLAIQKKIFKSANPADYFIGSMNVGWEVPGLADVAIQTKNLRLIGTQKQ